MDMVIVAGFLGSGKTTLVLSTIGKIVEELGKKVVVIVNDFGTVGIDGKVMTKYGLQVQELAAGCICCTLGADLMTTVRDVEAGFKPDLVVIEPTGVADPQAIIEAMKLYPGTPPKSIRTVVAVDAVRFDAIKRAFSRPLANQLKAADAILINKADAVSADALRGIQEELRQMNGVRPIIPTSATQGINIDKVVAAMVGA